MTNSHFRPVAWSSSSIIYTAHPTQPVIIARPFPSSKQFLVVSPDPITHAPTSYGPPSIISVAPNDNWLFAFFPGHETQGIACLWIRGFCADAWTVKEYWPFACGGDVITCAWAGTEREVCRHIQSPHNSSHSSPPVVGLCGWFILSSSLSRPAYTRVKSNPSTCDPGASASCLLSAHLRSATQDVGLLSDTALFHRRKSIAWRDSRHPRWSQDLEIVHPCRYRIHIRR